MTFTVCLFHLAFSNCCADVPEWQMENRTQSGKEADFSVKTERESMQHDAGSHVIIEESYFNLGTFRERDLSPLAILKSHQNIQHTYTHTNH